MNPRDYDSTLARIAGNIASGLVGCTGCIPDSKVQERIAVVSVQIANRIVSLIRGGSDADHKPEGS